MPPDTKPSSFARIAVNVSHVEGVFDYHINPGQEDDFRQGQLVEVPFGRQQVQGVILEFPDHPSVFRKVFQRDFFWYCSYQKVGILILAE